MSSKMNRRAFVSSSALASAAMALHSTGAPQSAHGADKAPAKPAPTSAPGALPFGKIGDLQISRLLLGGNLLTFATHSRDLRYVGNLAKHYNTPEKILETLALAEQHGINTVFETGADYVQLVPMDNDQQCRCPNCQALLDQVAALVNITGGTVCGSRRFCIS